MLQNAIDSYHRNHALRILAYASAYSSLRRHRDMRKWGPHKQRHRANDRNSNRAQLEQLQLR